jgi:hypothetical protein
LKFYRPQDHGPDLRLSGFDFRAPVSSLRLLGTLVGQQKTPFAGIFGIVFTILIPVMYGLMGFITGAIGGLLYNLFAKLVGGFELELDLRLAASLALYPIVRPLIPSI